MSQEIKIRISKIVTLSQDLRVANLIYGLERELKKIGLVVLEKSIPKLKRGTQNG